MAPLDPTVAQTVAPDRTVDLMVALHLMTETTQTVQNDQDTVPTDV